MQIANVWGVSVLGDEIVILFAPRSTSVLSQEQALNLAAWLVALADPSGREFPAMLEHVRGS